MRFFSITIQGWKGLDTETGLYIFGCILLYNNWLLYQTVRVTNSKQVGQFLPLSINLESSCNQVTFWSIKLKEFANGGHLSQVWYWLLVSVVILSLLEAGLTVM